MTSIYSSAIDIDLYHATMLMAYHRAGMANNKGIMEVFTRKLPAKRSFMVCCGTERVMEYLHNFKFNENDIRLIKELVSQNLIEEFTESDGNYLASLDFGSSIKVRAMYDGDVLFATEPVLQLEGPTAMIQYVEKRILGIMNSDVRVASKAARIILAAGNSPVIEMGGRRAHEETTPDIARACYIAGFYASSSVAAYAKYGIPCVGSMAHCWIMSHNIKGKTKRQSQQEAFANWSKTYKNSTYLLDTYNTVDGSIDAIKAARRNLGSVRLDSGDLAQLSVDVRRNLYNAEGCASAKIMATNDLNEYKILKLRNHAAHIDMFGVGTEVVCTPDSPTNNFVYKLVSIEDGKGNWKDVAKFSADGKATFPCAKQVRRYFDPHTGVFTHDEIIKAGTKVENNSVHLLTERNIKNWNKNEWNAEKARMLFKTRRDQMPEYLKLIQQKVDDDLAHKYTVNVSQDIIGAMQELSKSE